MWYHCVPCSCLVGSYQQGLCKATVTPDRTISGSYDWLWAKVRPIGRQCLLRSPSAVDWIISTARAIVGNLATSGSYQRPMYDQSWRPATDGTINRSLPPATDRTSNRAILWPIVRVLLASCDRVYDKSWHPKTDGTINRRVQRSIARSIVASCDRS